MQVWDKNLLRLQEQSYILYLNACNEIIEWKCLSTGTSSETCIDIKLTIGIALGVQASKIIIAHNHPSCILKPSHIDILFTRRMVQACLLMDIKVEDNLIVCHKGYYSFAEEGLLNAFKVI